MLDDIVPQIHDAALEPKRWPGLLARLSAGFNACNLLASARADRLCDGDLWSHEFDLGLYRTAPEDVWRADRNSTVPHFAFAPIGRLSDRREFIPDERLDRDVVGRHFFAPDTLYHCVLGILQRDDETNSYLMFGRPLRAPEFEHDELRRMRSLTTHLGQAMRTHRALRRLDSRAATFEAAIDRLALGVMLTDGNLRIAHTNAAAERMLEAGDGLRRRHGHLRLATHAAQGQLAATARRLSGRSPDYTESRLMLQRPSHAMPYTVTILPALGDASSALAPRAQVLVMIADPEAAVRALTPARLEIDFALTPSEARAAALAGRALPVVSVAQRLGLSPNTVKSHLRSVYTKLGVHSQPELVRLLMARTPPAIDTSSPA